MTACLNLTSKQARLLASCHDLSGQQKAGSEARPCRHKDRGRGAKTWLQIRFQISPAQIGGIFFAIGRGGVRDGWSGGGQQGLAERLLAPIGI